MPRALRSLPAALGVALTAALTLATVSQARAAKAPKSPEALQREASHIVVGKVTEVFTREEPKEDVDGYRWLYTYHVAAIEVELCEKGEDVQPGDTLYAHYWRKKYQGFGFPPPDHHGQDTIPDKGDGVRVFLLRDKSGRLGVLDPNGFEIREEPESDEAEK